MFEAIYICIMLLMFLIPFVIFKLWFWVGFLVTVLIALGIWEFIAWKKTGQTLSRQYFSFATKNPAAGFITTIVISIAWFMLMMHLLFNVPVVWN